VSDRYINSDPVFYRLIRRCVAVVTVVVLTLAVLVPAPLQPAADIAHVPNPSRAAWFLVWMQELVSYGTVLIYLPLLVAVALVLLPWWPGCAVAQRARWLPDDQKAVNWLVIGCSVIILGLTLVALFLRGENWGLVWFG